MGTSSADIILGLGGNVSIARLQGTNIISGGPGDDTIGDDLMEGGPGNGIFFGAYGNDTIIGGDRIDFVIGDLVMIPSKAVMVMIF